MPFGVITTAATSSSATAVISPHPVTLSSRPGHTTATAKTTVRPRSVSTRAPVSRATMFATLSPLARTAGVPKGKALFNSWIVRARVTPINRATDAVTAKPKVVTAATPRTFAGESGRRSLTAISRAATANKASAFILPPAPQITYVTVNNLLRLWALRGQNLAPMITAILQLVEQSPVDLSAVLGPVLLLAQGYAEVQCTVLDFIMNSAVYQTFSLDLQDQINRQAVTWSDMSAFLGGYAFEHKLPNLLSITQSAPAARLYGATGLARAIDVKLENTINVPILAGITVNSFWSSSSQAIAALSRLLTIDYVLSNDAKVYYGPSGNVGNILDDAVLVLSRIGPKAPSVPALLTQIKQAIANGYNEKTIVSLRTVKINPGTSLPMLAFRLLGDPELWREIADFNQLEFPFISDDFIEKLGRPEQTGVSLTADGLNGSNTIQVTGAGPFFADERILLVCGGNLQVATIVSGAFASTNKPVDWDNLTDYDVKNDIFTLILDQPLVGSYPAATTVVSIYPAIYDTGIVLGTGETLLIPNTLHQRSNTVTNNTGTAADPDRYGADIQLIQKRLQIVNGDFAVNVGKPNLLQAIQNRFYVTRGDLVYWPLYGTGLDLFVGLKGTPFFAFLVGVDAVQTIIRDPRISKVNNPTATIKGDVTSVSMDSIELANGQLIFPVTLEVPS